jgi:TolA-binding protein
MPDDPEVRAKSLLQLADTLMEAGKVEAAMERYRMILERYPRTKAADTARKKVSRPE